MYTYILQYEYVDADSSRPSVLQEEKQQQKLAFERHLEEKQKEHTQLVLMNTSRKENMLNSVRQVHSRLSVIKIHFLSILCHVSHCIQNSK